MLKKRFAFVFLAMVAAGVQCATAGTLTGEQIVATFSGVVLQGTIANDPAAGETTYLDNTATAAYNVNNGSSSSSLSWGTYSGTGSGFDTFSLLVFVGNTIPSTPTTPFDIGSFTFLNGTSDLDTLIFGVTMNFYAGSVSSTNFLGSDNVVITTTNNIFGVPGGLAGGDDDYVNICGTFSTICGTSIEAVESSEGGTGVVVNLSGTIAGDPTLTVSSVALAGGQNSATNGFLGTDATIGSQVPEPASWALTAFALALGCLVMRRRMSDPA
jgi:hypothetical protein